MSLTNAMKAKCASALARVGAAYVSETDWTLNGESATHNDIIMAVMRSSHGIPPGAAFQAVEEYLQTYRRAAAITVPALGASTIHVGAKQTMPISLDTHAHAMPDPDSDYTAPINWYVDSNGAAQFVFDTGKTYSMVYKTTNGTPDFGGSLASYPDIYRDLCVKWYTSLSNASRAMCEAWNNAVGADWQAKPFHLVRQAFEDSGVPSIVLEVFTCRVEYIEGDESEERADLWTGISFSAGLDKSATYIDFLQAVYSYWQTLPFKQIPEMPKIYSNDPEKKAFSLRDLNPYMVQCPRPLSQDWTEWLSKFTADEQIVILAWIWAVCYAKNKGRQSLWIVDQDGYSGKSVFTNALKFVLGHVLVAFISKDSLKNQFAYSKIWDKRLIVYPDCKNRLFPQTEIAHTAPGGDSVDVEGKGRASFTAQMDAKFLVCSNANPQLNPEALHERSRWIVVNVNITDEIRNKVTAKAADGSILKDDKGNDVNVGDANFGERLLATVDTLMENAYHAYKKLCPTDSDIILPNSVSNTLYSLETPESIPLECIAEEYLFFNEAYSTPSHDLYKAYMEITSKVTGYKDHSNTRSYGEFTEHLEKKYKIKKSQSRGDDRRRVWPGIKINQIKLDALKVPARVNNDPLSREINPPSNPAPYSAERHYAEARARAGGF